MAKKKGNKTEAKAAAKSVPRPAGEGEPERVEQAAEENPAGLGTELGPEPIAQRLNEKADEAAGQQEQQTQQQTKQEQKQQEEPAEVLQPVAEETAKAQVTCDPEQDTGSHSTEMLNLLREFGEADPDSLLGSEEVPANLVTELFENGDLLEHLARTAGELDALSNKFTDISEKIATEHLQFEVRLQSAEEQARNEALEAAQRRNKFQQLQLDCEALVTQLTQAQEKLARAIGAAAPDTGTIEATPLAGNASRADAPEEFEDASGQSQEDDPRQEFAEARDGPESDEADEELEQENGEAREKSHEGKDEETSDEDESTPDSAEKKGWLGGWFKK